MKSYYLNIQYLLGASFALPFLPLMGYQAKSIRKKFPELPEATDLSGRFENGIKELKLLCIGESTIAGVGAPSNKEGLSGSIANILSKVKKASVSWQVVAKSGYTAAQVNQLLLPKLKGLSADLIIIGLGANDTFKLNPPWKWKKQMDNLIHSLNKQFPVVPIVICNLPPINNFPALTPLLKTFLGGLVKINGQVLQELVPKYNNLWFLNEPLVFENLLGKSDENFKLEELFSDGIHPSPLSYKLWADKIVRFILDQKII